MRDDDSAAASFCEHLLESLKDGGDALLLQATEAPDQAFHVYRPQLIQSHESGSAMEAAGHAPRIGAAGCRHRCHDHRAQVFVQFVR
jgi:hypothetical protein